MVNYIEIADDLKDLFEKYPQMKVFTALVMAERNFRNGNAGFWNIRSDWDKYRDGFGPYRESCEYLKQILLKHHIIEIDGYRTNWIKQEWD